MANRGFDEPDGRFSMGDGDHSTSARKNVSYSDINRVAGRTSVGEQVDRGGWTRSDTPYCDDNLTYPAHKYQGGSAGTDDDDHDVAAYPGTPTPTPGTTY